MDAGMGNLELLDFLGGPWDGERRKLLPMPTIFVKAGGEYRLKEDAQGYKWYEFSKGRSGSLSRRA